MSAIRSFCASLSSFRGVVRFSGGIILSFLTVAVGMASEHLRPAPALYPSRRAAAAASNASNVFSQTFDEETVDDDNRALDEEDRLLCLLLEAFPGIAHETLAIAYARADRDPNRTAEILTAETRTKSRYRFAQSSDTFENWHPPDLNFNPNAERLFLVEQYGSFAENRRKTSHSNDFNFKEVDTHQLKNGHGDFGGASVWRDSRILAHHSRPPEVSSEPVVGSGAHVVQPYLPEGSNRVVSIPAQRGNNGNRSSKLNWGKKSSSTPPRLSAATGSVSNQIQRRANGYWNGSSGSNGYGTGSELAAQREGEVDDGLYSGKIHRRKKSLEKIKAGEDSGSGGTDRRWAGEDFLHSMFQGEFAIDLVRDVLAHYEGDTGKALETLLNIGSTSSGFDYSRNGAKALDPAFFCQGTNNEDIKQPHAFLQDTNDLETDHELNQEAIDEGFSNEDQCQIFRERLCTAFPTVEQSFLSQVLQAAEWSYFGALDILKESGLTPVGEQHCKAKLNPAEVLQALFRTEPEPQTVAAGPSEDPLVTTQAKDTNDTSEPWSVVAAKPRINRNPQVQTTGQKLSSNAEGEYEYARHRASATEYWETMKMYMTEANAAYNRGDRARAGLLSDKGAEFKELALAASSRASQNIFNVRNKDIQNNITIDLHAQHVTEAVKLLHLHLKTLSQIPSVHVLTVITGQGSHSAGGQAKIKPAVTRYLDKRQVPWMQKNPGCIIIRMSDVRSMDTSDRDESYSDSE